MNVNLIVWNDSIQYVHERHTTQLLLIMVLSSVCTRKQIYYHTCRMKSLKLIQASKHNFLAVKYLLHILPSPSILVPRYTFYIY